MCCGFKMFAHNSVQVNSVTSGVLANSVKKYVEELRIANENLKQTSGAAKRARFSEKIRAFEVKKSLLDERLGNVCDANAGLTRLLQDLQQKVTQLEAEKKALNDTISTLKDDNTKLRFEQLPAAWFHGANAEFGRVAATETIAARDLEIKELQSKNAALEKKLEILMKNTAKDDNNKSADNRTARLQSKFSTLKVEHTKLRAQANKERAASETNNLRAACLESELSALKSELDTLKAEHEKLLTRDTRKTSGRNKCTCGCNGSPLDNLYVAAGDGCISRVIAHANAGVDLMEFSDGWNALHTAAVDGHVTVVSFLLDRGVDARVLTRYGEGFEQTALELAQEGAKFRPRDKGLAATVAVLKAYMSLAQ